MHPLRVERRKLSVPPLALAPALHRTPWDPRSPEKAVPKVHILSNSKVPECSVCLIFLSACFLDFCHLNLQVNDIQNIKSARLGSGRQCVEYSSCVAGVLEGICSVLDISIAKKTSDCRSNSIEAFSFSKEKP